MAKRFNLHDGDYNTEDKSRCPVCTYKLTKKHEGMACTTHGCPLQFKIGKGWVYISRKKENSLEFFRLKYDFDIERHENIKEWLMLKSQKIYEKGKCEICESRVSLQVHHILSRSSHPELALDIENLMVLCKRCHLKIHEKDKYKFSSHKNKMENN